MYITTVVIPVKTKHISYVEKNQNQYHHRWNGNRDGLSEYTVYVTVTRKPYGAQIMDNNLFPNGINATRLPFPFFITHFYNLILFISDFCHSFYNIIVVRKTRNVLKFASVM